MAAPTAADVPQTLVQRLRAGRDVLEELAMGLEHNRATATVVDIRVPGQGVWVVEAVCTTLPAARAIADALPGAWEVASDFRPGAVTDVYAWEGYVSGDQVIPVRVIAVVEHQRGEDR